MAKRIQDICPAKVEIDLHNSIAARSAIHNSVVYECSSTEAASSILGGTQAGFAYQRDGHPNATALAEKCRQLHGADHAVVTCSGMAATNLAMISQLQPGDHILLSDRLYGGTSKWVQQEANRLGIQSSSASFLDKGSIQSAMTGNTKMLVGETISNPLLRVIDIQAIADLAHENNALLMIDNTFASPVVCSPIEFGADIVVESLTKIMNGHGDVTMGVLCAGDHCWDRVESCLSIWGWTSSPMDCWLAERGLATLYSRLSMASITALKLAVGLTNLNGVQNVVYPGLKNHADFELSATQFGKSQHTDDCDSILFSHLISMELAGGLRAANQFISNSSYVRFCPSLGELCTTLSHPGSTSHRALSAAEKKQLGISDGTIRLSVGLESADFLLETIKDAIDGNS